MVTCPSRFPLSCINDSNSVLCPASVMASLYRIAEHWRSLQISKDFDGALSSRSTEKLDSILDDNVVVHKGGISLGNDVTGKSAVKEWIQAYIDKYEFTHEVICGAVDEQAQVRELILSSVWCTDNMLRFPAASSRRRLWCTCESLTIAG